MRDVKATLFEEIEWVWIWKRCNILFSQNSVFVIIDHVCQWPINMHTIQSTIANTMQSPICFLLCISLCSLYLFGMIFFSKLHRIQKMANNTSKQSSLHHWQEKSWSIKNQSATLLWHPLKIDLSGFRDCSLRTVWQDNTPSCNEMAVCVSDDTVMMI